MWCCANRLLPECPELIKTSVMSVMKNREVGVFADDESTYSIAEVVVDVKQKVDDMDADRPQFPDNPVTQPPV